MSRDLGFVQPDRFGKWHWPFASMQPGDSFKVWPHERPKGAVVNMVHTRGATLGKRFRTGTAADGSTQVTCVDATEANAVKEGCLQWPVARLLINGLYGPEVADRTVWEGIEKPTFVACKAVGAMPHTRTCWFLVSRRRFKVTLEDDGFHVDPLDRVPTVEEWIAARLLD